MNKRNGFTLIELLAVIVILAVIALISTPLITDTIEKSRRNAAIQSAISYMDTVEFELSQALLQNSDMPNKNGKYEAKEDGMYQGEDVFKFTYKGTKVLGSMSLKENHVSKGKFTVGNYKIFCDVRECSVMNVKDLTLAEQLINDKVQTNIDSPTNGLYAIGNNGEVVTSSNPREYRYIGSNPDNYIKFNNELWRIIGIFDEQVKLIRKDPLDGMYWDQNRTNDWNNSTLQIYFNGDYLNSLNVTDQSKIDNYTWKLGGSLSWHQSTAQHWYDIERGTTVYSGRPTEWTGKIALIYPSDYAFSTSGGLNTNRSTCLSQAVFNWSTESFSDCKDNNWIYDNAHQWTLTPCAVDDQRVFYIDQNSVVYSAYPSSPLFHRPTMYLKSHIELKSGAGTENDPYILK